MNSHYGEQPFFLLFLDAWVFNRAREGVSRIFDKEATREPLRTLKPRQRMLSDAAARGTAHALLFRDSVDECESNLQRLLPGFFLSVEAKKTKNKGRAQPYDCVNKDRIGDHVQILLLKDATVLQ